MLNSLITLWSFLAVALEGLPISSSSHASILTSLAAWLGNTSVPDLPQGLDHFLHVITVIVLIWYFYPRWLPYIHVQRNWWLIKKVVPRGFIVELITVFLYVLFSAYPHPFRSYVGFLMTGLIVLSLRYCPPRRAGRAWDYPLSILLGIAQGLALLPGISRLGITYCVARWYGLSKRRSFELSFLIEWPISLAGFLKGTYILSRTGVLPELLNMQFFFAMVLATILLYGGLGLMNRLSRRNTLFYVGWYLIGIAVVTWYILDKGII